MHDHDLLRRWAADTWRSFEAMTDPDTGLPTDSIAASLDRGTRSGYTSPTNIGGLLWSTVAARDLGLVDADVCHERLSRSLATLARLEVHDESGMFFNWYDDCTGALLRRMPDGGTVKPFLSSVDNGWLAAGLMVAAAAEPALADDVRTVLDRMDFAVFHDAAAGGQGPGGRLSGGFWDADPGDETRRVSFVEGNAPVFHTRHHYDLLDSEPRIASYVGIAHGQIPPEHYASLETPVRHYRGRDVVPTFGGSMFEALMPTIFVPEAAWAPDTWGVNEARTVALQREYAMDEKAYGYWGFSPSACPGEGYSVFGVPPIASEAEGYPSERDGEVVVTPHASAMALMVEPDEAADNLARIESELGAYGPGGFIDSVDTRTGRHAGRHLSLDQSMVLGALANVLSDDCLRRWFCTPEVEGVLRPVVAARRMPLG
ncbi:glucoamylase family protein [Terrabacter sp. 2RAF25]|uniref:glucoamylase family protein n=1 Tax=Terrabacter sp. 2RAF25 TaxID=3232998 RepID=UPI003F95B1B8